MLIQLRLAFRVLLGSKVFLVVSYVEKLRGVCHGFLLF